MTELSSLRGLVFDLDGTLADSRLDFPAMRAETGCPEGTGLLEYIGALDSEAERLRANAVIHHYEMLGASAASWIPGAQELLAQLTQASLPIGIFTRNSREAAGLMINSLAIPCDTLIAREDAVAKPDPEGLLKIARGWELDVQELLCVGDFLYDLQAASNAGMRSCLYDPLGSSPHTGHADLVVRHFDELGAMIFGDPLHD
ncbi:MAG: HAD-IA family hydrolase [Halieaceae bacterium]